MKFQKNLKTFREEMNLSQADMAKRLNITRQAYNHYETGKRVPTLETLKQIADILGTTTDCLLGITNNPMPAEQPPRQPTLEEVIQNYSDISEENRKMLLNQLKMMKFFENARKNNEDIESARDSKELKLRHT